MKNQYLTPRLYYLEDFILDLTPLIRFMCAICVSFKLILLPKSLYLCIFAVRVAKFIVGISEVMKNPDRL